MCSLPACPTPHIARKKQQHPAYLVKPSAPHPVRPPPTRTHLAISAANMAVGVTSRPWAFTTSCTADRMATCSEQGQMGSPHEGDADATQCSAHLAAISWSEQQAGEQAGGQARPGKHVCIQAGRFRWQQAGGRQGGCRQLSLPAGGFRVAFYQHTWRGSPQPGWVPRLPTRPLPPRAPAGSRALARCALPGWHGGPQECPCCLSAARLCPEKRLSSLLALHAAFGAPARGN